MTANEATRSTDVISGAVPSDAAQLIEILESNQGRLWAATLWRRTDWSRARFEAALAVLATDGLVTVRDSGGDEQIILNHAGVAACRGGSR